MWTSTSTAAWWSPSQPVIESVVAVIAVFADDHRDEFGIVVDDVVEKLQHRVEQIGGARHDAVTLHDPDPVVLADLTDLDGRVAYGLGDLTRRDRVRRLRPSPRR